MEMDHTFGAKHGFTGSAKPTKEMRPHVPGFKRGQNMGGGQMSKSMGEEGGIDTAPPENMKHGGLSHMKSHHKNYSHGGRVEHDDHPKHESHGKYDKHGFHIHKGSHKKHKED